MSKFQIALNGCDDATYIEVDLTQEQYDLVLSLESLADAASSYGCQPTLSVTPLNP